VTLARFNLSWQAEGPLGDPANPPTVRSRIRPWMMLTFTPRIEMLGHPARQEFIAEVSGGWVWPRLHSASGADRALGNSS